MNEFVVNVVYLGCRLPVCRGNCTFELVFKKRECSKVEVPSFFILNGNYIVQAVRLYMDF